MESPDDLKKREIQKDKEILDRMFDRQNGTGVQDPDHVSDNAEKMRLIHNIINSQPSNSNGPMGNGSASLNSGNSPSNSGNAPDNNQNMINSGLLDGVNLNGTGINIVKKEPVPMTDSNAQNTPNNGSNDQQTPSNSSNPNSNNQLSQSSPKQTIDNSSNNNVYFKKNTSGTQSGSENKKVPKKTDNITTIQNNEDNSHIRPEVQKVMLKRSLCVVTNPIQNCSAHYRGNCIECETDYHLINNICKPLSEENRRMFCRAYNHDQNCVKCKNGYVLVAGKCLKFKKVINCRNQVYYPNGKCLVCKNGFYFDEEEEKCLSREHKYFEQKKEEEIHGDTGNAMADEEDTGEDIGFDRNCLLVRNNSDKTCFMCKPGFYMDKKGNCLFSDGGYSKSKWFLF